MPVSDQLTDKLFKIGIFFGMLSLLFLVAFLYLLYSNNHTLSFYGVEIREIAPSPLKVCSVASSAPKSDKWRDSIIVPNNWTKADCEKFRNHVGAIGMELGCIKGHSIIMESKDDITECGW